MVSNNDGNWNRRRSDPSTSLPIQRSFRNLPRIPIHQYHPLHNAARCDYPALCSLARNMGTHATRSRAVPISVPPNFQEMPNFSGTMPMGLATIITMLVYVAVPLSSGFLYFTQVLFWIDVVFSLLSCFGVLLYMYATPDFIDKGSWLTNIRLTS
jgi:hypothetical protein